MSNFYPVPKNASPQEALEACTSFLNKQLEFKLNFLGYDNTISNTKRDIERWKKQVDRYKNIIEAASPVIELYCSEDVEQDLPLSIDIDEASSDKQIILEISEELIPHFQNYIQILEKKLDETKSKQEAVDEIGKELYAFTEQQYNDLKILLEKKVKDGALPQDVSKLLYQNIEEIRSNIEAKTKDLQIEKNLICHIELNELGPIPVSPGILGVYIKTMDKLIKKYDLDVKV